MRYLVALFILGVTASGAYAQVQSRPTDPPVVTAENEAWYQLREPVQFAGEVYFPAGAVTFFNGNTMVRTGHYNGIPLYADTTIEPYSIVYVPIGRGLLQPYERQRRGELAGTTGSRTPAFPVRTIPESGRPIAGAAAPPTAPPLPIGAVPAFTPEAGAVGTTGRVAADRPVGTGGVVATPARRVSIGPRRPTSNDGVWLEYMDEKWVSAGRAVPLRSHEFMQIGEYAGHPVFVRNGLREEVIYIPTVAGMVAPYKLKE